jgi:hypothetical protein
MKPYHLLFRDCWRAFLTRDLLIKQNMIGQSRFQTLILVVGLDKTIQDVSAKG